MRNWGVSSRPRASRRGRVPERFRGESALTTDIATSYAFDQESFGANVIATKQPIASAFVPPKGTTNTADWGKNLMTIQEGALAAGETSGNLGMYLGLGVKDDIVEPENEICE